MTEVVINSNINRISAWYHTRPMIEETTVEKEKITVEKTEIATLTVKKSLFARIKYKIFKKFTEKDRAVPVLHIKTVKAIVHSKIGATLMFFR
jgi:hypothetical protein